MSLVDYNVSLVDYNVSLIDYNVSLVDYNVSLVDYNVSLVEIAMFHRVVGSDRIQPCSIRRDRKFAELLYQHSPRFLRKWRSINIPFEVERVTDKMKRWKNSNQCLKCYSPERFFISVSSLRLSQGVKGASHASPYFFLAKGEGMAQSP